MTVERFGRGPGAGAPSETMGRMIAEDMTAGEVVMEMIEVTI